MIKFSETGRKLRDGIIPAGTTVWKKLLGNYIVQMIVLGDGIIPTTLRKQISNRKGKIAIKTNFFRYTAFRKCRVPKVYVVSIDIDGVLDDAPHCSNEDTTFYYKTGSIVTPNNGFDPNPDEICTAGIHCFLTRKEAENYDWQ